MEELVQHSETVPKPVEDGRIKHKGQNGKGCNMPPHDCSGPYVTEMAKIHRSTTNMKKNMEPHLC